MGNTLSYRKPAPKTPYLLKLDMLNKAKITFVSVNSTGNFVHVLFTVTVGEHTQEFLSTFYTKDMAPDWSNKDMLDFAWDNMKDEVVKWIHFKSRIEDMVKFQNTEYVPKDIRVVD